MHAQGTSNWLLCSFEAGVLASCCLHHRRCCCCRFEPCGLNQLYAMRYGTVPIAHATGGLMDTIENYNPFSKGESGTHKQPAGQADKQRHAISSSRF